MKKKLLIVESPAKAKTIEKFLGGGFTVTASLGHIRDLPKSQLGIDVENGFKVKYVNSRGKDKVIRELRKKAENAEEIFLATDPDREGEAIAWHLAYILKVDPEKALRVEFNEITKEKVVNAVAAPRRLDMPKINAQQARRVLDRLVGYKLSPFLWKKVKKGLSAGRVQSVTLRMICDREQEIRNFVSEEYWTLETDFNIRGESVRASLVRIDNEKPLITDKKTIDRIISESGKQDYFTTGTKTAKKRKNPYPPFTTSTLQQEAFKKINFSTKKTMSVAQQLYEGIDIGGETIGLITYMRTDSVRLSDEAVLDMEEQIRKLFGKEYVGHGSRKKKKAKIQDAHEAVRPTYAGYLPEGIKQYLTADQFKLYRLIWNRAVASRMAPMETETLTVEIASENGKFVFKASNTKTVFKGFARLYGEEKQEGNQADLPADLGSEPAVPEEFFPGQHFTQPPGRFSEAGLVKKLEEEGIGRPSTYAPTISTLQSRGYVQTEKRVFKPTELGELVVDILKESFPELIDIGFTANLEKKLDEVEEEKADWVKVLEEFYRDFAEDLEQAEKNVEKVDFAEKIMDEKCELCGRNFILKTGRYGKFMACSGFPECKNTKPHLEKIGMKCPKCGEGDVILRKTKRGRVFYGCSEYPDCDFVSWEKPTDRKCPECGEYMTKKENRNTVIYKCSSKDCGYEEKTKKDE